MNELLSAIHAEYATLQNGLSGLLSQLQSVNARLREARGEIADVGRQVDSLAPAEPEILTLEVEKVPSPSLNGHATAPARPLGESLEGQTGEGASEGESEPTAPRKPWLPKTWEEVRGMDNKRMGTVLDRLGLPRKRGAGSHMANCKQVWNIVQSTNEEG